MRGVNAPSMAGRRRRLAEAKVAAPSGQVGGQFTGGARVHVRCGAAAARASSRYGHRDATMILIGYRHGLTRMTAEEIALETAKLVGGDRANTHGDTLASHEKIPAVWNGILDSCRQAAG